MALVKNAPFKILSGATGTGAGAGFKCTKVFKTFQAVLTGSGAVSATIKIEISLDGGTTWTLDQTITIGSGTAPQSGLAVSQSPTQLFRANVTAITGTSAAVDVWVKQGSPDGDF